MSTNLLKERITDDQTCVSDAVTVAPQTAMWAIVGQEGKNNGLSQCLNMSINQPGRPVLFDLDTAGGGINSYAAVCDLINDKPDEFVE